MNSRQRKRKERGLANLANRSISSPEPIEKRERVFPLAYLLSAAAGALMGFTTGLSVHHHMVLLSWGAIAATVAAMEWHWRSLDHKFPNSDGFVLENMMSMSMMVCAVLSASYLGRIS